MEQLIHAGTDQFYCITRPFPVTNALGFVRTVLKEYELTNTAGQHYKLYKTHTGNWFDLEATNPAADNAYLTALKMAIAGQAKDE